MFSLRIFAFLLIWAISGPALAQSQPAELPPEGFDGREFVDSKGCLFQRAAVSGTTVWVARTDAENVPICAMEPTVAPVGAANVSLAGAKVSSVKTNKGKRAAKPKPVVFLGSRTFDAADSHCLKHSGKIERHYLSDGRRVTHCMVAGGDVVAFLNALGAPGLTVDAVQLDDAAIAAAEAAGGYRLVWANGPLRDDALAGLSSSHSKATGQYVQVAAFAQASNRDKALAHIADLGFGARTDAVGSLTAVLAGPFSDQAQLRDALQRLRAAGYAQAFIR